MEEKLETQQQNNIHTSYFEEGQSFTYKSPLKNHNYIWGSHHRDHQELKEIYDMEAKTLEKENQLLKKMTNEKSAQISQLESHLKDFQSNNKQIFTANCELTKDLGEKDAVKKTLGELEKDLVRRIESNKLKLLFYENKNNLLETINKEVHKNQAYLTEENEFFIKKMLLFF